MVKTYLETEIVGALQNRGLIEEPRQQLFYRPDRIGEHYRKVRRWVIRNFDKICIGGLGGATSIAWFFPRLAAGVAATSLLGLIGNLAMPLDEFLYRNAAKVARRTYRNNIVGNWHETYDDLNIRNRAQLDNYVLMAQTTSAIQSEFQHYENKVSLGIAIARIADILSEARIEDRKVSGLSLDRLVDMISRQKFGSPDEVEAVKQLTDKYSPGKITSMLRRYKSKKKNKLDKKDITRLQVLDKYTKNYEFVLRISEVDHSESTGSQLSRGHLYVSRGVGSNAGCYAGYHSNGYDFPRMTIKDDAGPSLATHASRGLFKVGGDAEQGVLEKATGGIGIIEGVAKHDFAHHMDDCDWPAIAITAGGMLTEIVPGNVENGIVVSFNRLVELPGPPTLYRFDNGMIVDRRILESQETAPIQAADIIRSYIQNWRSHKQSKIAA